MGRFSGSRTAVQKLMALPETDSSPSGDCWQGEETTRIVRVPSCAHRLSACPHPAPQTVLRRAVDLVHLCRGSQCLLVWPSQCSLFSLGTQICILSNISRCFQKLEVFQGILLGIARNEYLSPYFFFFLFFFVAEPLYVALVGLKLAL